MMGQLITRKSILFALKLAKKHQRFLKIPKKWTQSPTFLTWVTEPGKCDEDHYCEINQYINFGLEYFLRKN